MDTMKIIAFTGMPFSGKSEAVKIAFGQGYPVVRMGDMVWNETKKRNLELNDRNVGMIANTMRDEFGMDIWAQKTVKKILMMKDTETVVVDGIRNREEIEYFKRHLGDDFALVAVQASDVKRMKRGLDRGREDDNRCVEDISERDRRELAWGLGDVIASADIVISNEESLDLFCKQVKNVLDQLKGTIH